MGAKEEFIDIYQTHIKREGATELLKFLKSEQSDFFSAPASTRFHLAYEGDGTHRPLGQFLAQC